MKVGYGRRLWLVFLAGLVGWLAGYTASFPAMLVIGWRDSEHDPKVFAATIGIGLLAWAGWTLLLAGLTWLLFAVPCALLAPPAFLVRHRSRVLLITTVLTATLVILKMLPFQDYAASKAPLRFILYMPYGSFALFLATATAWWYVRSLARTKLVK